LLLLLWFRSWRFQSGSGDIVILLWTCWCVACAFISWIILCCLLWISVMHETIFRFGAKFRFFGLESGMTTFCDCLRFWIQFLSDADAVWRFPWFDFSFFSAIYVLC
jgi:hypothetical protein